jgi:hypothetical protein
MNAKQLKCFNEAVGHHTRLVNSASEEMDSTKIQIQIHGRLEFDESDQTYYLRGPGDPHGHGTNGITFTQNHVVDCGRQPSGIYLVMLR